MIVEEIFGSPVITVQCPDSIYQNPELTKSVEQILDLPTVKNRWRSDVGDSHKGSGLTTVGQPYIDLAYLPGAKQLTDWISEQLLLVRPIMAPGKTGSRIHYKRSWTNRLYRGGQGMCHNHTRADAYIQERGDYNEENFCPDAVAIFYVDVPEGSSQLVLINNGIPDLPHTAFTEKHFMTHTAGQLVIHSPQVWHAVTEHQSDSPRNVYVFDADYV